MSNISLEEYNSILQEVEKEIDADKASTRRKAIKNALLEIKQHHKDIHTLQTLLEQAREGDYKPVIRKYLSDIYEL